MRGVGEFAGSLFLKENTIQMYKKTSKKKQKASLGVQALQ